MSDSTNLKPGDVVLIEDIGHQDAFFISGGEFKNTFWEVIYVFSYQLFSYQPTNEYISLRVVPVWPTHESYNIDFNIPLTFFSVKVIKI